MTHRHHRTHWKRIKGVLWPRMGLRRLFIYYKHRMGRLSGTPYFIAAGFATGVAISFTPFVGFHLMTAGIISWMLGGSIVAMVIGSVIAGNPWTFPFIWISTYKLGKIMLGQHMTKSGSAALTHQFTFSDLLDKPMELLLPMTLGSLPFALVSWGISFYFVRQLVKKHKETRLARIYNKTHSHWVKH